MSNEQPPRRAASKSRPRTHVKQFFCLHKHISKEETFLLTAKAAFWCGESSVTRLLSTACMVALQRKSLFFRLGTSNLERLKAKKRIIGQNILISVAPAEERICQQRCAYMRPSAWGNFLMSEFHWSTSSLINNEVSKFEHNRRVWGSNLINFAGC